MHKFYKSLPNGAVIVKVDAKPVALDKKTSEFLSGKYDEYLKAENQTLINTNPADKYKVQGNQKEISEVKGNLPPEEKSSLDDVPLERIASNFVAGPEPNQMPVMNSGVSEISASENPFETIENSNLQETDNIQNSKINGLKPIEPIKQKPLGWDGEEYHEPEVEKEEVKPDLGTYAPESKAPEIKVDIPPIKTEEFTKSPVQDEKIRVQNVVSIESSSEAKESVNESTKNDDFGKSLYNKEPEIHNENPAPDLLEPTLQTESVKEQSTIGDNMGEFNSPFGSLDKGEDNFEIENKIPETQNIKEVELETPENLMSATSVDELHAESSKDDVKENVNTVISNGNIEENNNSFIKTVTKLGKICEDAIALEEENNKLKSENNKLKEQNEELRNNVISLEEKLKDAQKELESAEERAKMAEKQAVRIRDAADEELKRIKTNVTPFPTVEEKTINSPYNNIDPSADGGVSNSGTQRVREVRAA